MISDILAPIAMGALMAVAGIVIAAVPVLLFALAVAIAG